MNELADGPKIHPDLVCELCHLHQPSLQMTLTLRHSSEWQAMEYHHTWPFVPLLIFMKTVLVLFPGAYVPY